MSRVASQRRVALAALSFVLAAAGLQPLSSSPHRWFVALLAPALVLGMTWRYVSSFVPFGLLLLLYEWLRTGAHRINPHAYYLPQIRADELIGLGTVPSVRLQGWLWNGTHRGPFENELTLIHSLHLAVVLVVLFCVLAVSQRAYLQAATAFLATAFAAVIGFVLFPAAPPWLAAQHGLIGPLTRIRELGRPPPAPGTLTRLFDDNQVAAIPSLHAGWSMMVVLVVHRWFPRLTPLAVAYWLTQQFAVVYLGEHYVIDLVIGDVLAIAVWIAVGRLGQWPTEPAIASSLASGSSDSSR